MFLKYNWKALLWAFFILVLCGIPGRDLPHLDWMDILSLDKWAHAFVFAVLVIIGCRGLQRQFKATKRRSNEVWPILLFAVVYSPVTELLQGFVFEDRSAEMLDMLANWVGCMVGVVIYRRYFADPKGKSTSVNT